MRSMRARAGLVAVALCALAGCVAERSVTIQRDSLQQVYAAEASQVKLRNAQSRVFDTTDSARLIEAIVSTFQDLGVQVEVVDDVLGIVSGKLYLDRNRPGSRELPSYVLYEEDALVLLSGTRGFRTWGPFRKRADLVRVTATVRRRNASQLLVRTSAQFHLRPVESPEAYQRFYAALEKTLAVERTR